MNRASEVMGIAGIDVFANLFLVAMLLIGLGSSELRLKSSRAISTEKTHIDIDVVVTPKAIFVADSGPIAIEGLASRLAALGDKASVRVRVEPDVAIEREHAVLAAVMSAGAASVNLSLSGGDKP